MGSGAWIWRLVSVMPKYISRWVVGAALVTLLVSNPVLAAGDGSNETICPNEGFLGFRTYLPNCGAYEFVTPPFKSGIALGVDAVSPDGDQLIVNSIGAFAGTESDPLNGTLGAVYVLARSRASWLAFPVTPPASLSPDAGLFGISADTDRTLWEMRGSASPLYSADLYIREANGTYVKIGPVVPPAGASGPPAGNGVRLATHVEFAGASKDLSRVLLKIAAVDPTDLWPGDTTTPETTARSLYEYVGTGNTHPMLVGVNGEGRLISDCETALGSEGLAGERDVYNAVSANGETVFFTASGHNVNGCGEEARAPEVSELYARLSQSQTVAISEPLPSQCEQCQTTRKMPAVFQGASEDGSKVFFLTEQELFPGDSTSNIYEYDFNDLAGEKLVRVSTGSSVPEVLGIARISEDGSHVYFVAKAALTIGSNSEGRSPKSGEDNLYVFERDATYPAGRITFVATLLNKDARDWSHQDQRPVQATPDGRFLVFASAADLTPGDASSETQIFEYDALQEKLVRVSVGASGYIAGIKNADENSSSISTPTYSRIAGPTTGATHLAISADGSRVLFQSMGALTQNAETAAMAGAESIYEYHSAGAIENGNVYLISDGTNTLSPEVVGLDASGADAFFITADPLLPSDVDTQFDIYDARVDGGFPTVGESAKCNGDACQGQSSVPPSLSAPGSISEHGGENLTAFAGTNFMSTPKPKATHKHKYKHKTKKKAKKSSIFIKANR